MIERGLYLSLFFVQGVGNRMSCIEKKGKQWAHDTWVRKRPNHVDKLNELAWIVTCSIGTTYQIFIYSFIFPEMDHQTHRNGQICIKLQTKSLSPRAPIRTIPRSCKNQICYSFFTLLKNKQNSLYIKGKKKQKKE